VVKEFFLNEKPVMALVTIRRSREDIYCSRISRKIDTTYAHTVKIISRLEEEGLIDSRKEGRRKILELTERGERYAERFEDLVLELEKDLQEI
jgi:predicted transcriptional regulator